MINVLPNDYLNNRKRVYYNFSVIPALRHGLIRQKLGLFVKNQEYFMLITP